MGIVYLALRWHSIRTAEKEAKSIASTAATPSAAYRALLLRVAIIVFLTTAVSSLIFQATTFALPKIFLERLEGLAVELATWFGNTALSGQGEVASVIGFLAFIVFAIASIAQLVVGSMLDKLGPRRVFMTVAIIQIIFFATMPGLTDAVALAVALGFMLGAFGQIPINDYMIGKTASGAYRARIFGVRYVVGFTVLAATLPLIAFVYKNWGFDTLFYILATAAVVILAVVAVLPKELPTPETVPTPAD